MTCQVASSVEINQTVASLELLSSSKIYIDHTRALHIDDILEGKVHFEENKEKLLGYGFSPNFDVWIAFTLHNNSEKSIEKILEYNNPITTYLTFFDPDKHYKMQKDGLFTINPERKSINPIFTLHVKAGETKTYYLKASSYITTLIVKLTLWDTQAFYEKEIQHQLILALFFGAMAILGLYNLFIFFFTRDNSYFFYFLYIFGVLVHHAIYIGIGTIYLLNQAWIMLSIHYASLIASFPIFALALFTKSFLQTKCYPRLHSLINVFLILLPLSVVIFTSTDSFNRYRNLLVVIVLAYLLFVTIYAALKKNRQAYFILVGWCAIFLAILFMLLSSTGIFNIYLHFPYFIEASLVFEAMIFSIALADRIKQLQSDRETAQQQLIFQQKNEKERLTLQVEEKTDHLKVALDEKEILLKELNHRVKNNMQMIVSLIRLQNDDLEDERLKDVLTTIQNRISTMKHLHELLYKQNQISYVNTFDYFDLLLEDIQDSYSNGEVLIDVCIEAQLKIEEAIYCGIILNELVTNSFKYAFVDGKGHIWIHLEKQKDSYILSVKDDGIGYNTQTSYDSLGLTLVNTLAKDQLKGTITINAINGVNVIITWHDNEKN